MPTPAATAAATPTSSNSGLRPATFPVCTGMPGESALMLDVHPSDGHVHDVLVRTDQAIADFDGGAEGHRGFLGFEHDLRQLYSRYTLFKFGGDVSGTILRLVDAIQALLQHIGEAGGIGALGTSGRGHIVAGLGD